MMAPVFVAKLLPVWEGARDALGDRDDEALVDKEDEACVDTEAV
jgi:hypothetical protein